MIDSPALTSSNITARPCRSAWLLLALSVIIAIALKLITADRPIARDVMLYTVIGHEMFQGRELYTDLFEHKPPLFLFVFGVASAIAGYGPPAVLLLNITFTLATLAGVYSAGRTLGKSALAGAFAAVCWALVSNDVNMHAHQPMPECFINACLVWAFALFLKLDSRALHVGRCLAIGTALMLASQVKQPTVIVAAGFALVHLFTRATEQGERKRRFAQVAIIASVGIATWAGLFAYYAATGRFQMFYDALFTYNKFYAGIEDPNAGFMYGLKVSWWNFNNGLVPRRLFPALLIIIVPLLLTSVIAWPFGYKTKDRRAWMLWLAYFVSVFILVTSPGRGYPHYYLVYLPMLVTGAAGAFAILDQRCSSSGAVRGKWALSLVCTLALLAGVVVQLTSANTAWERPGYGAYYRTIERVSAAIDQALLPEESLYVWDYQPAFYVLPKRSPPAGVFYDAHATKGPLVEVLTSRVLRMFESQPPQVLIIHESYREAMNDPAQKMHPVHEWIRSHARPIDWPDAPPFLIYVLNDGPLAKRIEAGQVKWNYAK